MVGIDANYDGARKAYAEGGVNGLAEYLFPATVLKNMGMDNSEKNRAMVMNAYNEGGADAVRQQIQAAQTFVSSPYGENLTYRYEHATNYLPSLNPSQFAQLYDAVDQQDKGTTGFNTITQQEVIDYLNQNPTAYDAGTALQYWNALDQMTSSRLDVQNLTFSPNYFVVSVFFRIFAPKCVYERTISSN